MKKVININFQGRVIPIEESAYDILKQYVESLRSFFANEEGRDEIINDIEGRIAELFGESLKKGSTCITDDDVNSVINSIGRPEDFEGEETKVQSQLGSENRQQSNTGSSSSSNQTHEETADHIRTEKLYRDENNKVVGGVCAGLANYFGIDKMMVRILFVIFAFGFGFGFITYLILWVAVPSSASTKIGSVRKRLFRDPDNKLISGVCGGLSSYFGVNVWIPRILFLLPFLSLVTRWNHWGVFDFPNFLSLSFSPGATLVYIILWLVLPEAITTSDKLEMKGEKVDINSIKNTIQKDMEGFGQRAKDFGKEIGEKASEFGSAIGSRSKQFGAEAGTVAKRTGTTFGDIIVLIFKIFAYFILAVVLIALVGSLFGVGIAFTGFLPLKSYLINDGWQNILLWGTYIFFIWIPVIGIITWIIRRIAKIKSNSSTMRFSFIAMWVVGWFCVISLIASLKDDFDYHNNPVETNVTLTNPAVQKLELRFARDTRYYFTNSFLHMEPFLTLDGDTAYVNNTHIRILKSDNDSFHATILKMANGATRSEAEARTAKINFNIVQKDSTLLFDRGIAVSKTDKFRNQAVYVTVYVPVGKRIWVQDNLGWGNDFHVNFGDNMDDWNWRDEDEGYDWGSNIEYVMTADGLKRVHPENDDDNSDNNGNNDENNNVKTDTTHNKINDTIHYHYQHTDSSTKAPAKIAENLSEQKIIAAPKAEAELNNSGLICTPSSLLLMKISR